MKYFLIFLLIVSSVFIVACTENISGEATRVQNGNLDKVLSDYVTKEDLREYIVTVVDLDLPSSSDFAVLDCITVSNIQEGESGNEACERQGYDYCTQTISKGTLEVYGPDDTSCQNLLFSIPTSTPNNCGSVNAPYYGTGCGFADGEYHTKLNNHEGLGSAVCCSLN
jgi:hypothetical protein